MKNQKVVLTQEVAAELTVNADAFRAYNEAKQRENAAKKEAEAARVLAGIPPTEDLVRLLGISEGGKGSVVVKNGNNVPVGKISVFWKDEYSVKAGFSSRVS